MSDEMREAFPGVLVEQHQGDCIQRINIPNARLVQAALASKPAPNGAMREAFEKKVRGAIYSTWHDKGIANVDGVARIAVGAIWHDIAALASKPQVTEGEIREIVEEANAEYWRPSNEHNEAIRMWTINGKQEPQPQPIQGNGSIIDCITRALMQKLDMRWK